LQEARTQAAARGDSLRRESVVDDASSERFNALVDLLGAAYCEIEVLFDAAGLAHDFRFLDVSETFASLSGLSDAAGQRMRELVPAHESHWFERYGQVVSTRQPARFTEYAAAMGRWFDVNAFPVGSPDARRVGVVFRDVTARELGRMRSRANEVRAALALAIAGLGTFRFDVSRGVIELDERMCVQWGEPAGCAPLTVAQVLDRVHPDDRARVDAAVRSALDPAAPAEARGRYAIDYRIVWTDGSVRWIAVNGRASFDGEGARAKPLELAGTVLDITERKQAEAALRDGERRLATKLANARTLQQLSTALIHEQSAEAMYEQILHAALVLMGADAAALQMLDPGDGALRLVASRHLDPASVAGLRRIGPGDGSCCGRALAARQRVVIDDIEAALRGEHLDTYRHSGLGAAQATPLLARDGRLLGMLSTAWKQPHAVGERDFNLFDVLARQVADLVERSETIEALRASEARLRENDARKDEFLATLAHELRNPLATISTAVGLLGMAPGELDAVRVQEMMERQLAQMVRLIDDLMEVARISRGTIVLADHTLDLAMVARDAVDALRPAAALAQLALSVDIPEAPLPVRGDRVRLAQVLSNLLGNAVRYTDAGGRIGVRVIREDGQAMVEVSDSGIGIAREKLKDVFEMFVQVNQRDARSHGGLGIGLALALRLARMHGGDIEAYSAGLGEGSRFLLRLPLADGPSEAHAPESAAERPRRGGRVLVVDDNRDAADTTALAMESFGAEARVVYDGPAALALLEHWLPDVILLDLGMPGMDGHEVAAVLRQSPRYAKVCLVALTGWGQPRDLERTRAEGFDNHLVKPASADALRALLPPAVPVA
jgi:signal transduction histidine kinase/ActR/RegA family two-component response regulator